MAYISRAASPINSITYESAEAAIAAFTAPKYAGDTGSEITMTGENTFRCMGLNYTIEQGENPKEARREARTAARKTSYAPRAALNAHGQFRGSRWLSREMDREDSDY